MTVKIILTDDHKIVREGLRTLLENEPGMEVVGEAESGRIAVQLARKLKPDVVIMDVSMPDLNGIEATAQILHEHADIKIIALSMYSDKRFVSGILKAGASGYLLKDCAFEELVTAIRAAVAGQTFLSPGITGQVIHDYIRRLSESDDSSSLLTSREREVLQMLAEGKTTKQMAEQLNLSVKTVETHRRQIMDKLDLRSVAELTKYAIREGLTSLGT
ncbi:MAG: response regulator transcription factor [Proteobacteria bacterium]|nr:response regulator transcription factor [Pseudomonadota bacterium]